jgi:hypothetical protein
MLSLIKNQRGNTALIALMGLAIAGGVLTLSQQDQKVQKVSQDIIKRSEGQIIVDKMKALASFLVANNVVICKQGVFKEYEKYLVNADESSETYLSDNAEVLKKYGNRCKWTGKQFTNGSLKSIDLSKIKFSNPRYFGFNGDTADMSLINNADFGALVFDVDTVALFKGQASENDEESIEPVRGKIYFKLYDFGVDASGNGDKLGIAERIGVESIGQTAADSDHFAVLIKAEAVYNRVYKNVGSGENASQIQKDQTIERYFAIRRPLAMPRIEINQAVCKSGCDSSLSINNNPECRGQQSFDSIGEVKLTGRLYNPGPGTIYELSVQRNLVYDKSMHPNKVDPPATGIDILGDKDYLLPGEEVEWVDSIVCETFKTTVNQQVTCSRSRRNAAGNPLCWDSQGNEVDPAADASSDSSISQHREPAGKVTYSLSAGNEHLIEDPIGTLEANIDRFVMYKADGQPLRPADLDAYRRELQVYVDDGRTSYDFYRERLRTLRFPVGARLARPVAAVNPDAGDDNQQVQSAEWDSKSRIEPFRIIGSVSAEGGVPQKKETTVNIQIIPTH